MMGTSNKVKKLFDQSRSELPKLFRWVLVLILYLIIFGALDSLAHSMQLFPGLAVWYPPDGLSLAFLLTFGVGFTPLFGLAALISSLIIFRLPVPPGLNMVWALILSAVYGTDAFLLRRRIRINPELNNLRDTLWLILTTTIVSTVLAIIAISALVNFGLIPPSQYFNAFVEWWIGEMTGVLVFMPFLLVYVMPWLKRFIDGQGINSNNRIIFRRPSLQSIGQLISIPVILYISFGIPALSNFRPFYLIAGPLIWIALDKGFLRVSLAIVAMYFGTILAIWLFKYDSSRLGELQFLMFGIYASTLLTGAIVTKQKRSEEDLRQREIHNRALIENAPDAITLLGEDGLIKYTSPSAQRITGYTLDELIGTNPADRIDPDDLPVRRKVLDDLRQTPGSVATSQYRFLYKDGTWHWLESTITNLLNEPSVHAFVFNIRDINENKLAEAERNQSEALFRALFELSPDSIVLIDPNDPKVSWPIIDCNRAACQITGYRRDELIGQPIDILNAKHKSERVAYRDQLQEAGNLHFEVFHRRKDGSIFPVEVSTTLFMVAGRELVLGIVRDITARKQAEEVTRDSQARFEGIVNMAVEGIISIDENQRVILFNQGAERIFGYTSAEALGSPLVEFLPLSSADSHPRLVQGFGESDTEQSRPMNEHREVQGRRRGGEVFPAEVNISKVTVRGKVIYTAIVRDISERKEAEEKIINSNEELKMLFELSHSMAEADSLEEILQLVGRFAVKSVHTTFARIALLEDGKFTWRSAYPIRELPYDLGIGERNPASALPYSQRILQEMEPVVLRASDPKIKDEEKKALLLGLAQTLCMVPLCSRDSSLPSGKLIGLLMLGETRNESREPFTPGKIRLAQTIADSAAIAIRRMVLREQTERHLQQLAALANIDRAISSTFDLQLSLGVLLQQVSALLRVDATDVLLFDSGIHTLVFTAGRGFRAKFPERTKLRLGEGYAGQAALKREIVYIPNLAERHDNPRLENYLSGEQIVSYMGVPLVAKGELRGVLEIFQRATLEPDKEWLSFLNTLAGQAAIAIDSVMQFDHVQRSNNELFQAYDETIEGWSHALDLRDKETEGHTQRVTELTVNLARKFLFSDEQLTQVRRGALLHDIGKMGIPDGILLKPGPLTDEEWVIMRKHPTFAYELLSPIQYLRPAIDIPYCHHEKWDGTGYPRGLRGEQIPLAARIFAVVDVWDALTSDRVYRAAWPKEKVLEHIRLLAGTHFDPEVVKVCLESGLLGGETKRRILMEPVQWSEEFSVGVRDMDQQHQQLIKLLNRLIAIQGTLSPHTETVSDILMEMTQHAQIHFKAEEQLMETYGYPGLEEQKKQHADFRKKTVDYSAAAYNGVKQVPEALLIYLTDWWTHHILEEDMGYRAFFKEKGIE